jgi:ATP-dependent DNA ligase
VSLPVGEHGTLRHEALFKEAPLVFRHACKMGLKGIVSKRLYALR